MQTIGFQEAVERILGEDPRYHADAYAFLRDALDGTLKRRKKSKKEVPAHVSAAELLEGFRLHGLQECGPMAITVLEYWGVCSCEDVGHMVFNLVKAGVFGKTDDDTLQSFREGYDFQEAFVAPFRPDPDNLSETGPGIVGRNA
jgi:uncharacterized repeat protein (TIGR04138 family)